MEDSSTYNWRAKQKLDFESTKKPEVKTVLSKRAKDVLGLINTIILLHGSEQNVSDKHDGCRLRKVFLDGQNVAINSKALEKVACFSCLAIAEAILFFMQLGHSVAVILPERIKSQFRPFLPTGKYDMADDLVLNELDRLQMIIWVPRRFLVDQENPDKFKVVRHYDDNFIIDCAHKAKGIVVSRDRFMDIRQKFPDWIDTINRRISFKFLPDGTFRPLLPSMDAKVLFTADVFEPAENNNIKSDDEMLQQLDINLNLQAKKPPFENSNNQLVSAKRGFEAAIVHQSQPKSESNDSEEPENLDFLYLNHNAWQAGTGIGSIDDYDDDVALPEGAVVDIDATNQQQCPSGSFTESTCTCTVSDVQHLDEASLLFYYQFAEKIRAGLVKRSNNCLAP